MCVRLGSRERVHEGNTLGADSAMPQPWYVYWYPDVTSDIEYTLAV